MSFPESLAAVSRRLPDVRGKVTAAWKLHGWYMARGAPSESWRLDLRDGSRYVLPSAARMTWTAAYRGAYDAAAQRLVVPYIAPHTIVLDIGAALGLWTVPLGRAAVRVDAAVWAVEPYPPNLTWLERNVELNGLDDVVHVVPTALGDEAGLVTMRAADHGGGSVGNAAVNVKPGGGLSVPVQRLDDIELPERVSVIKVDVEGFELRVLRGAWETIRRDRPVIIGEFSAAWIDQRGDDLGGMLDDLRSEGYEVLTVAASRSRPWRARSRSELAPVPAGAVGEDLLIRPLG